MTRGMAVLSAALLLAQSALAQDPAHCHDSSPKPAQGEEIERKMRIPDAQLLDQEGDPVLFYSDLVQGRLVAMNFVFTTCTTICPPMGANFVKLQKELKKRSMGPVQLISISVDPVVDTPERLKLWSSHFRPESGWTLLTGTKAEVDGLLKALGAFTPDKFQHSPIVLLGNDSLDRWTRAYGLASPSQLADMLEGLAAEQADSSEGGRR